MLELQLQAICGANEHNGKQIDKVMEDLTKLLYPGDRKDEFVEMATKLLIEETRKVYKVTPAGQAGLQQAMRSSHPGVRDWAKEEMRNASTMTRRPRTPEQAKLPPGVRVLDAVGE